MSEYKFKSVFDNKWEENNNNWEEGISNYDNKENIN